MSLSLPAGLPAWIRSRPFLLAGVLRALNLQQRYRLLLPAAVLLLLAGAASLTLPSVGRSFEIAAAYPFAPFMAWTAIFAATTMRRKAAVYRSLADSWLAPLAAPSGALLRVCFIPLLELLLSLLAIAIPFLLGSLSRASAATLWLAAVAAFVAGSLVGWFSGGEHGLAEPDFHHVTVRRERAAWAQNPRLEPLSYWAPAQARVFTKPKVMGRATFLVLMILPMGTPGETAIAVAAGAWVLFYLGCLSVAAVSVAFKAAWWLAPTTLDYRRFATVLGYRVWLAQLWTWACVIFLTYAAGRPWSLRVGLPMAVLWLLLSAAVIAVTCGIAMGVRKQ